jgi:hypothetical protein
VLTTPRAFRRRPAKIGRRRWPPCGVCRGAIGSTLSERSRPAPFPAEPIGTGATWTVDLDVEQDGVKANEVSTLEITKLQRQLVTIKRDVQQSAAPQTFRNPGSPTEVELTEFTGEGAGVIK